MPSASNAQREVLGVVGLLDRLGREPPVLAQVVRRRLADPRRVALVEHAPRVVDRPRQRGRPGDAGLDGRPSAGPGSPRTRRRRSSTASASPSCCRSRRASRGSTTASPRPCASRCRPCAARPAARPRPRRAGSASSGGCRAPAPACPGSSTCTKRSSPARRSISATARSGCSCGGQIEPSRRASWSSHSSRVQSFSARHISAASSGASCAEVLRLHRREDRVVHVVLVEQLLLDEPESEPGKPSSGRASMRKPPLRIRGNIAYAPGDAGAELREVALPPRAQPRVQRAGHHRRVDVAVDERDRPLGPGGLGLSDLDVGHCCSLSLDTCTYTSTTT